MAAFLYHFADGSFTGALALGLADHLPWPRVYQLMALAMLIPIGANLRAREPVVERRLPERHLVGGVVEQIVHEQTEAGGRGSARSADATSRIRRRSMGP